MATSPENTMEYTRRIRGTALALALMMPVTAAVAAGVEVPEVEIISVTPKTQSANDLVPGWEKPRKPRQLSGEQRQALLEQVSGGGKGGIPLLNTIQTQGRTPEVRQLILTVKRPWYVHRAFLSSEGAERVDARSVMRFGDSGEGRAIVGINLIQGNTYLFDFLVDGEGEGVYTIETDAGVYELPDPDGTRDSVLVALKAEQSGWVEINLRRSTGSFDLHSVEVTLALGPQDEAQ